MAKFVYEAKAVNGQNMRGEIDAVNEIDARNKLRAQRISPLKLVPKSGGPKRVVNLGKATPKELQIFTRQLATLLGSGIAILQSLEVLSQGVRETTLTKACKMIINSLSQGKKFADALADHPRIFDKFYINMVNAAEKSGQLDTVLNRLAVYIEKSVKIQGKIKGALMYPAIIVFVALAVIAAIMIFVIPKFQTLFTSAKQELPAITQMVVKLSDFFVHYWWAVGVGIVGGIFALKEYYQTSSGREQIDAILLRTPIFGALIQKGAIAKFTRTLSTLLSSGVGIIESLEISSKVVGNTQIERAILRARDSISEGKTIVAPLSKEKFIPQMVQQMISVGEQTGNLDQMLGKIADFYEDEVDVAVGALTSIIEPVLMVVLGTIIAFIVVAMYLPIFQLAGAVTG
jgi:type IV pilus assembly protein PilC